jgi:hypothetical protein
MQDILSFSSTVCAKATVLGVGFGVFECNRLLRVCEQTAQTCDNA